MNDTSIIVAREPRTKRPRIWLRGLIVFVAIAVLVGGLLGFHQFKSNILKQIVAGITSQRPTVATAVARMQAWQDELTVTGTLRASRGADLAAEVAGIVDELNIPSGTDVAAGTVLMRLRPDDDTAKLEQLQAAADLAAITYERDVRQLRAQAVAQSTVDTDAATLRSDRAQVAAQQALMAQKIVRAPFAGRLGIRQVDIGQYLAAGTTIVTLQALDPIYADVYVPQRAIGQVKVGQSVQVQTQTAIGPNFTGEVTAINPKADPNSRMIQLRISVHNQDGLLLPGMYATASIAMGAPQQRVTVPATAISVNPYGNLVYIVHQDGVGKDGKPNLVVHQQFVTTGDARGDQIAVTKGLQAGDQVVVAGQLKLRNNIPVLVNNSLLPTDDAAPTPADE
jgi:membrane fusion protein (multidrug efflux system)